jgi:hypothetical protein
MKKKQYMPILIVVALLALSFFIVQGLQQPKQEATSYFQATITYTDGTERSFPPSSTSYTITDPSSGKTVSKIQVELYVKPVFTGTVSSWVVSTSSRVKIFDMSNAQKWYSGVGQISKSGGAIPSSYSNVAFVVTSATADVSYLSGIMSQAVLGDGDYYYCMALESPLTMTLTFSNGQQESLSTSTTSGFSWKFHYSAGNFQSLSVSWNIVPT